MVQPANLRFVTEATLADPTSVAGKILATANAKLKSWAKNPDMLVVGNLTYENGLLKTADVVWPDGVAGLLTITARHATSAVTGYKITRVISGQPTVTYTQPTITRDSSGLPTNVPQITVA